MKELHEIQLRLDQLPNEILQAERKVIQAKEEADKQKALLERDQAIVILKSQRNNATEKKASAVAHTYKQNIKLIEKNAEYESCKGELNQLKNEFDSIRKQASLEIELINKRI